MIQSLAEWNLRPSASLGLVTYKKTDCVIQSWQRGGLPLVTSKKQNKKTTRKINPVYITNRAWAMAEGLIALVLVYGNYGLRLAE